MNRYFIVFFSASCKNGTQSTGHQDFKVTDNAFISFALTRDYLMDKNPEFTGLSVNNIIELNEKEYNEWEFKPLPKQT